MQHDECIGSLEQVRKVAISALGLFFMLASVQGLAETGQARQGPPGLQASESSTTAPPLIQPDELARIVQSARGAKPLIFYVGYRVLYLQAHIPHSEYIGPASEAEGIQRLRKRVQGLPHTQAIVVYCGCCPWNRCPNVNPAYKELHAMGFSNVKLLYIADNFGKDWVDIGYPVANGE